MKAKRTEVLGLCRWSIPDSGASPPVADIVVTIGPTCKWSKWSIEVGILVIDLRAVYPEIQRTRLEEEYEFYRVK